MAKKADGSVRQVNMVAEGAVLEGTLCVEEDLRVSGRVVGAVKASARVVVASAGTVDGKVVAAEADVGGAIQGDLDVAEQLVLRSGARVEGVIKTGTLVIEDGAIFNGTCRMMPREAMPVQPRPQVASRSTPVDRPTRKRPEPPARPPEPPVVSKASSASSDEKSWLRQGGLIVLGVALVMILAAGAYYGFGMIQGKGGSQPPVVSSVEPGEASEAETPDETSVLSISETPPHDPVDFEPPIDADRQAAGLDRIAMEQARQRVFDRRAEPEVAALFQQAETARQEAMALFGNGDGEEASRAFRTARDLFARMQETLDEKDSALLQESLPDTTTEVASDPVAEAAPDSVAQAPADAVPEEGPETVPEEEPEIVPEEEPEAVPEEDPDAVLGEVQPVVQRLARQLKRAIEQEDVASMQAFYYRGWESFFDEADAISAVVRPENMRLTAGEVTADVYLDLSYQDEADQPQQRTRAYVWTLRRMGEEWVLMKVASL